MKCRHYEMIGEATVTSWTTAFFNSCMNNSPGEIANTLVMIGPAVPSSCWCDDIKEEECEGEEGLREFNCTLKYVHENHKEINTDLWKLLQATGMLSKVRRAIRNDLKKGDEEYGLIVRKEYGRELLANFLKSKPSPEWVSLDN